MQNPVISLSSPSLLVWFLLSSPGAEGSRNSPCCWIKQEGTSPCSLREGFRDDALGDACSEKAIRLLLMQNYLLPTLRTPSFLIHLILSLAWRAPGMGYCSLFQVHPCPPLQFTYQSKKMFGLSFHLCWDKAEETQWYSRRTSLIFVSGRLLSPGDAVAAVPLSPAAVRISFMFFSFSVELQGKVERYPEVWVPRVSNHCYNAPPKW